MRCFHFQAVGLDSCESFQEETVSDQDGQYRLRGLQVSLKKLLRVFILWLHNKLKSAFIQQSVVLHFAVLGTRHSLLGRPIRENVLCF